MNLGTKNNNWLNVRYDDRNKWKGQTGQEKGYCIFESVPKGLRVGLYIILKYISRGINTVEKIITKFAPNSENDTALYIKQVCEWSGLRPDDPISRRNVGTLIKAMTRKETGNIVTDELLTEVWAIL